MVLLQARDRVYCPPRKRRHHGRGSTIDSQCPVGCCTLSQGGSAINLLRTPPEPWEERITLPYQTRAFAEASRALGYQPYYALDDRGAAALVQVRQIGPARFFLSRSYVYPSNATPAFLRELMTELKRRRVSYARVGDPMIGVPGAELLRESGLSPTEKHTFVLDVSRAEGDLFAAMEGTCRTRIRQTAKEGVTVTEATDGADADAYWRLARNAAAHTRERGSIVEIPRAFLARVQETMVRDGQARVFLARRGEDVLAGLLCLIHGETMLAWHAPSTRDRSLADLHGPTACFWRAIRCAQEMRLRWFDFGGCTPGLSEEDSRHGEYSFKSQWGGELRSFYNGEAVFSRVGYALFSRSRR